jgi:hypothetical protein
MRRLILITTLYCFILALVLVRPLTDGNAARPSSQPYKTATLCEKNEKVIFSCGMQKSAKVLSLCGSKELDKQKGYVQYRFGQPGKIELEYPAERKSTQTAFSYSRYTRPLVTYLALRFETNGYKYSIHQDDVEDIKPPDIGVYINITPPGKEAIEMKCRQPTTGSLMTLEDIVAQDDHDATEP